MFDIQIEIIKNKTDFDCIWIFQQKLKNLKNKVNRSNFIQFYIKKLNFKGNCSIL